MAFGYEIANVCFESSVLNAFKTTSSTGWTYLTLNNRPLIQDPQLKINPQIICQYQLSLRLIFNDILYQFKTVILKRSLTISKHKSTIKQTQVYVCELCTVYIVRKVVNTRYREETQCGKNLYDALL